MRKHRSRTKQQQGERIRKLGDSIRDAFAGIDTSDVKQRHAHLLMRRPKKKLSKKKQAKLLKERQKREKERREKQKLKREKKRQQKKIIKSEQIEDDDDDEEIIDDIDPESLKTKNSTAIILDEEFFKRMKESEDPDSRILEQLEKKLGIHKKKKREREEDAKANELREYVEEKRRQKKRKTELEMVMEEEKYDGLDEFMKPLDQPSDEEEADGFNDDNIPEIDDDEEEEDINDALEEEEKVPDDDEGDASPKKKEDAPKKYIPPHLRKDLIPKDAQYMELHRLLRGQLNKLSPANISIIITECLQLYDKYPKNTFHEVLSKITMDSMSETVHLLGQFIVSYSAFIVGMHNIGGMELGAFFIEKLIKKFDEEFKKSNRGICTNLVSLLCHLYNFQMIHSGLIYDTMKVMCEEFSELGVELLYRVLNTCGFQLRTEDALLLKNAVNLIEEKAKSNEDKSKRKQFLMDMISDLKNNRMKRTHEMEQENYKNMKKMLEKLQQKYDRVGDYTLKMSYEDLMESSSRGRWWLVGSAWAGKEKQKKELEEKIEEPQNDELELLAKEQRIGSGLRKNIFIIIMGSEDYTDAYQKLAKIGIERFDKEIIRMIVHCCSQEKTYNLYYELLCKQVASTSKKVARTFQYVFWDHFKELNNYEMHRIANLSRLLSALIGGNVIGLSVFKIVNFAALRKQEVVFYRLFMMHFLLDCEDEVLVTLFLKLLKLQQLEDLHNGLSLFLFQYTNKEVRRTFIYDYLPLRDVSKKNDKKWLKENEKIIRKRAKLCKKVLDNRDMFEELQNDIEDFKD